MTDQSQDTAAAAEDLLASEAFATRLSSMDMEEAEATLRHALAMISPEIEVKSIGEKPRGVVREIELNWCPAPDAAVRRSVILLPAAGA